MTELIDGTLYLNADGSHWRPLARADREIRVKGPNGYNRVRLCDYIWAYANAWGGFAFRVAGTTYKAQPVGRDERNRPIVTFGVDDSDSLLTEAEILGRYGYREE